MNHIISYTILFRKLKNYSDISKWFKKINNQEKIIEIENFDQNFFIGYQNLLSSVYKSLINAIKDSDLFDLEEDRIYFRAFNAPERIPLNKIPITCEKTSFIFGLINLGKGLQKAKTIQELQNELIKLDSLFVFLDKILEDIEIKSIEKNEAYQILVIYCIYTNFHNTESHGPFVFSNRINETNFSPDYQMKCLFGYFVSISYIWYSILKPTELKKYSLDKMFKIWKELQRIIELKNECEIFLVNQFWEKNKNKQDNYEEFKKEINNTCLNENNTNNEYEAKIETYLAQFKDKIDLGKKTVNKLNEIINIEFDEYLNHEFQFGVSFHFYADCLSFIEHREELFICNIWDTFDIYYNVLKPLIQLFEKKIPYIAEYKNLIQYPFPRIKKTQVDQYCCELDTFPKWNTIKNKKILFDNLSKRLFWYKVDVMESHSAIFNGVPVFNSLVLGEVYKKKKYKDPEKVYVKIFKDPSSNIVSLGILIESHGTISDFSGWLIFLEAATYGYLGFGPSLFDSAKEIINKNKRYIDSEEIQISDTLLIEFLQDEEKKIPRFVDELKHRNDYKTQLSSIQGRLFEAFVYKWINYSSPSEKVFWNEQIDKNEIDAYSLNDNTHQIELYECKLSIHEDTLNKIQKNIKLKAEALKKKYILYQVNSTLISFEKITKKRKDEFEKSGIKVLDNFQKEINKNKRVFPRPEIYLSFF